MRKGGTRKTPEFDEAKSARSRRRTRNPYILRPCDWHSAPFGRLQALPENAKPITGWKDRDDAFLNVAQGIRNVVKELSTPLAGPSATHTGTIGRKQVQSSNPVTSHSREGASRQGPAIKRTEPSNELATPTASSAATRAARSAMSGKLSKIHPTIWVALIAGMAAIITAYWQTGSVQVPRRPTGT